MQRKNTLERKKQIRFMAQFSILLAIEALVCFTFLGSIPMFGIVATTAMIPVIITSILLGTAAGTLMGFFAGLFSFLVWTYMAPNPAIAFLFTPIEPFGIGNLWSLVLCFVPRILVGTFTGLTYQFFKGRFQNAHVRDIFQYGISGVIGSLTNTILFLIGLLLFFARDYYAVAVELTTGQTFTWGGILGLAGITLVTNGVLEAVLAFILAIAVCRPIKAYFSDK